MSQKISVNNIDIDIVSKYLEQIKSYEYFGEIVNGDNSIEEENNEIIYLGNKARYANETIFKSKLVSMKTKLKLYLDRNKTCDKICQRNMSTTIIYEMKFDVISTVHHSIELFH
jgi:hypothetical protein